MNKDLDFFSGTGETFPEFPGRLFPLLLSWSGLSPLPDLLPLLFTFGIRPKFWVGGGNGEILPSFVGEGDLSFSLARLRESVFSNLAESFSPLLDLELDLLLNFDEELDFEEEEDFLESDFWEDLLVGLLSFFLELESWSLGEEVPLLFSDLGSLSSVVLFLLGSLLLGSLDSFSALGSYTEMFCAKLEFENQWTFSPS